VTAALDVAVARQIGEFELDVAFTAESGILVLFGPSGAGKSLTLALIAGLIRPDTGTIVINGHVVTDCTRRIHVSTQARRIGMVFQDGLLLPHRSVRRGWPTGDRPPFRVVSGSEWHWRVASPATRHWYFSTSRSPLSI